MHMDMSEEQHNLLCENSQEKCRGPRPCKTRAADFEQTCAVETHNLTRTILRKKLQEKTGEQRAYPDLTPGLNTYRKNPSVWTHCLGKNVFVTATRENTMTNLNLFPQHPKPMLLQRRWFCIILYHDRGVPPCFSMSRHMSRRGYHMTYHTTLAFCD